MQQPQRAYSIQQAPFQEQKQQPPMSRAQAMQMKHTQSPPSRSQQPQSQQPLSASPPSGAASSPFFGTFFPAGANLGYMPSPPMLPPAVAPAGGFASAQAMQAYMMRLSQQIAAQQQQMGWMQQPQFAAGGGGLPLVSMPPMLLPPAVMFSPSNGPATERTRAPPDLALTDKLPSFSPDRSSNGNATARGSVQSKPRRRKTDQLHHMATPPLLPAAFHPSFHASPQQLQQQEKQQFNGRSAVLSPHASGRPSTLAALPTFLLLDAILQTPEFSGPQFSSTGTGSPPSKSRKTLSSHANMRVAYSASGPAATRNARRASDIASESLAAGLPVQMVSSLREAGLVSTLFSPTGNTEAPRGSMPNDGSDRAFPWNMAPDSQNGESTKLPSLKRTASTTDANAAASPAPTAGASVTAIPADSGTNGSASPKLSSTNGAASAGSSPSKATTLQLPGSPGGAAKDPNSKRRLSFMLTSPDNNVRPLAEDDAGLGDVERLASALAAMQTSPGGSIDASGPASPDAALSSSTSVAVSATVSPTASVVPSTEASRAASPTTEARRLVLRPSRDGPGLPPDSNPPEEVHQSGVIYITREVSSSKKRVTLLNPAITAAEKAEKAAKEKERLRRYAERDQKKREAEEEKKYRQAEAEAAKESRAAARERMKNQLAEQGIQRQKEKEAREKAEREAALAAERAAAEEEKSNPSKPRPGVPSFLARIARTKQADAAETEARTKLRQELNPEIEEGTEEDEAAAAEAEEGEQVVPLGGATHKRSKKGSDGGMDGGEPVVTDRESRRMSRLPTSSRILSLADPKRAATATGSAAGSGGKKKVLLVSLRMINAAKRGDVEELRKILTEEFGVGSKASGDKNKSGETRAEFLNRPDKNGSSALFHAVWPGHEAFMALLLEEGASPNVQNTRRNTVMHLAVERGHDSIVRLLLRHGANPLISNNNNHASFQVLPNTREQLQWASFLYVTLAAIWKKANPNWVPDEEAAAPAPAAATDGAASVGNSPVLASAGTSPDTVSPITPDAAKPAVAASSTTDGDADASKISSIDSGSDEMHVLDDSQDHSVLSALSPNTPLWLNELYQIFQRKDATRTHTKHWQSKVMGIMRMTSGLRGIAAVAAATAAKSKHAAANKEAANKEALVNSGGAGGVTFDSSSSSSSAAPNPRASLTSSSGGGGGLANLLKQMKRSSTGKKSTKKTASIDSTASTGSGKDGAGGGGSGKSSARGSLEVHNNISSGPNTGRRGSTELAHGAAPGSSRRSRHIKGSSGSPPLSSRSTATAPFIVMPNASGHSSSSNKTTRDRVGSPTGHRALSPTPSTTATGPPAATSPAAAAAPATTAPAEPPAPTPVAAVLFPSASTVPAPTAAKVKTFSIFSASLQDMDEPKRASVDKQAGFSLWKKTFETTPTAPPTRR